MRTNFKLSEREHLSIWGLSDTHFGANVNYNYLDFAFEKWDLKTDPKMIVVGGDILEVASKHTGDSAHKQTLSVNEQLDVAEEYLGPRRDHILGITGGNHDTDRMVDEFNFDPVEELAKRLKIPYSLGYVHETLHINKQPFVVLCMHGKGSSQKDSYLVNKIERETGQFKNDLAFYGHTHRVADQDYAITTPERDVERRTVISMGHFLKYKGSYAHRKQLPYLPEAFVFVDIDSKLNVDVNKFKIDKLKPELVSL